jgi:hypothetical protein
MEMDMVFQLLQVPVLMEIVAEAMQAEAVVELPEVAVAVVLDQMEARLKAIYHQVVVLHLLAEMEETAAAAAVEALL